MTRKIKRAAGVLAASGMALSAFASSTVAAASPSKGTIRLMVDGLLTPQAAFGGLSFPYGATGVQAAAAAINATGGIGGRTVKIDECDNKGDPNQTAACGRLAKQDGDLAVVGTQDAFAQMLLPILQAEGIPYIGGLPTSVSEYTNPVSFQFDPGPLLGSPAMTTAWVANKCTRVVSILPGSPGEDALLAQQKQSAGKKGIEVDTVPYQLSMVDVTPTLSAALATHPNCMTYGGAGPVGLKFFVAARKAGFTGKLITDTASVTTPFLKALGAEGNGIVALSSTLGTASKNKMVTKFRHDLRSYLKGDGSAIATNSTELAQDGWSSVQLVKQAFAGSSTITSSYLMKKIPTMCDVNLGNVYPHVSFCKAQGTRTLPRVFNDEWQYFVASNGDYVATDGVWHNLSSTIPR